MKNTANKKELEIMQYFWGVNEEASAEDVQMHFQHKNWSIRTINKFLRHLVYLGYLNVRESFDSKYYYRYAISEKEHDHLSLQSIIDKFLYGPLKNFTCPFADMQIISLEESEKLHGMVSQYKDMNRR